MTLLGNDKNWSGWSELIVVGRVIGDKARMAKGRPGGAFYFKLEEF